MLAPRSCRSHLPRSCFDGSLVATISRAFSAPPVAIHARLAPCTATQVPLEATPPLLAASDALLVPLSKHPTFRDFVPSKLIDAMGVGRPVLLSAAGEAARILERAGAGIVVAPEDPVDLVRAVRWLRANPDEAAAMGRRGREFAKTRLRSVQAERLEQLLLDVVGER